MKKRIAFKPVLMFWVALVAALLLSGSCKKETEFDGLSDIKLVLYDENGVKTNSIKEGKDFSIFLENINKTDEVIYISQSDYQDLFTQLYPQPECLMIYKEAATPVGKTQRMPIGKPYDPAVEINFPAINLPPRAVNPGDIMHRFGFSWSYNKQNQQLEKGVYFSSFQGNITIGGISGYIDTEIKFEVY